MFITTANTLDTVPGPLRDRMEIIQLAGYTEEEKLQIAKRYLVPRQIERNGLKKSQIALHATPGCGRSSSDYTREAGVRNLEREIGSVCRKVARQVAEGNAQAQAVGDRAAGARAARPPALPARRVKRRTREPGVATGPGVDAGRRRRAVRRGDRDARQPGAPAALIVTGQLGDVMRESALAALSYVRGHAHELAPELPATSSPPTTSTCTCRRARCPKDGPSAGHHDGDRADVARHGPPGALDTAMTGEITLTGQVLPIGGLKEKSLAAQRAGHQARDRAEAQRGRPRGLPGARCARASSSCGWTGRRGLRAGAARTGPDRGYARRAESDSEREVTMAAKKKAAKAGAAAVAVKNSPYVQRVDRGRGAARRTSCRPTSPRATPPPPRATASRRRRQIFDDKKLQKDLKNAAESFRDASVALREAPKQRKGLSFGRLLLLAVVSAGVALAVSEGLRKKVLDALFGAEEEFEYTSTTSSPTSASQPADRRLPRS